MLAGISADYYLRLEQGRDRNPSLQVLESLARVLQLDAVATDHLLGPRRAASAHPAGAPARSRAAQHRAAAPRARPAGVRRGPLLRRARRERPGDGPVAVHATGREPAALDVPRPGRTRAVPGLGAGHGDVARRVPRIAGRRGRRSPCRPAGRRAVAGQRAVPAAVGPARRQRASLRSGTRQAPSGRRADAVPREARHRRHARADAGRVPRGTRHGGRREARPAGDAGRARTPNRRPDRDAAPLEH